MTSEKINVLLAIFTLILAGATVWLAIATWRMASVSKKSFDLESRPYFAFRDFHFRFYLEQPEDENQKPTKGGVKIGLIFRNPGKVLISYQVESIHITFAGITIDNPTFISSGGVIYPNDQTVFWYGLIPNIDVSPLPKTGVVEYEVTYSASNKKHQYRTMRKIQYTLNSLDPYNVDWLYLEEKDT